MNPLKAVPATLPDPPYPSDTRRGNWQPQFDLTALKQSRTWKLSRSGFVRAYLIRLWLEAWDQIPCGSYPNDDELIAVDIDMTLDEFQVHRTSLMRGWVLHADNRLYHPYISSKVIGLLLGRKNLTARQRRFKHAHKERRSKGNALSGGDNALVTVINALDVDVDVDVDVNSKQNKSKPKTEKPTTKISQKTCAVPKKNTVLNFDSWPQAPNPDQWAEILTHRKKKRASNTQRAIDLIGKQLHAGITAGYTFVECMDAWETRQWAGFNSAWMDPKPGAKCNGYKTVGERNDQVAKDYLAKRNQGETTPGTIIEGDFTHEH